MSQIESPKKNEKNEKSSPPRNVAKVIYFHVVKTVLVENGRRRGKTRSNGVRMVKWAFLWPKGGRHLVLPRKNAFQYIMKNSGINSKHKNRIPD